MSNRDDRVKELTNRLNHLRLERKSLAKKEQVVYHELRTVVFGSAPARNTNIAPPIPDQVKSEQSSGSEGEGSNSDKEQPPRPLRKVTTENDFSLAPIGTNQKLRTGQRLYITNKITHFREKRGQKSVNHRLARFDREVRGRVWVTTRSEHVVWRGRSNLKLAIINNDCE